MLISVNLLKETSHNMIFSVSDDDCLLLDQDGNPMKVTHSPIAVAYTATLEDNMFDTVRTAPKLNIGGPGLWKKATGLPARDLRILDPILSCPSTMLARGTFTLFEVD